MPASASSDYKERSGNGGPPEALGESEAFVAFQERLSQVAKVERPVLIVGERGTGKELAASRLHFLSKRWDGPLVALNCAALPSSLLESELFGHEPGAFTGAAKRRQGRFETAQGGTLFLDEIGLIPVEVQEKILRVVEYRGFERVGSSQTTKVDVRIIGATNSNLAALANDGKFKRDLLDRLSFEVLFLPPLRERREDIFLLAHHFAARMSYELGFAETPDFSEEAILSLEDYPWPGNIRELKNVVERAVYRSEGEPIHDIEFDPFSSPYPTLEEYCKANGIQLNEVDAASLDGVTASQKQTTPAAPDKTSGHMADKPSTNAGRHASLQGNNISYNPGDGSLEDAVKELELTALKAALEKTRFHQGEAAELLGMTYHQFRGLYRKYKADLP